MARKSVPQANAQAEIVDAAKRSFSSNTEMGAVLGVHRKTIETWRSGERIMSKTTRLILRMLADPAARETVLKYAATERG